MVLGIEKEMKIIFLILVYFAGVYSPVIYSATQEDSEVTPTPRVVTVEDGRKILVRSHLYDELIEVVNSINEPNAINFTFQDYTKFEDFIGYVSKFFRVKIKWKSGNIFEIAGREVEVPLTGTYYDYQILTSSVYVLVDDVDNIYINSDGAWLLRIEKEDMLEIKKRYSSILNHKLDDDSYSLIDKFVPGECNFFDGVQYPYVGSNVTVKDFMKIYNDDSGPISKEWRRERFD